MDAWDLIQDSTLETIFADVITGFPGVELEHAGVIETSLMQHYFPELVHMERLPEVEEIASFPPYDVHPQPLEGYVRCEFLLNLFLSFLELALNICLLKISKCFTQRC